MLAHQRGRAPDSTSSYTLSDIYARLDAGTAGSQSTFTEPSVAPGTGTMHTLNEIMAKAPMTDTNGGTAADMATGKTFWGLTSGEWGVLTGTATLAGVPDTGQTTCYDPEDTTNPIATISCSGTGQDGAYTDTVGVDWPTPRFITGTHGVVTDTLTGLIWLKNANCFGFHNWTTALSKANSLASGSCGLSDDSSAGDWRLPNLRELLSLIDYGASVPPLPSGHPFTNVQMHQHWSSSAYSDFPSGGWIVNLFDGNVDADAKTEGRYIWPVRGGQ